MMRSSSVVFAIVGAAVVWAASLPAATLSLVTGNSVLIEPGMSGSMTLTMSNNVGGVTNFNGWVVGVQLLPAVGATGTVTMTNLLAPTTNAAVTNNPAAPVFDPNLELFNSDGNPLSVNGSNLFTALSITSGQSTQVQTIAGSSTVNLGVLTIATSSNAAGTWNLFAINPNSADGERSYWYSNGLTTFAYGNLSLPPAGQPANSILLGTVTVTPVPEPGAFGLAAVGVLGSVLTFVRKKKCLWKRGAASRE